MRECKYCGEFIDFKKRFDGRWSSYDPGTDNFHQCKSPDEIKAHKSGELYRNQMEAKRISILEFYQQNPDMDVPKYLLNLHDFIAYEQWAAEQPPAPIPSDLADKARSLGLKNVEKVPF